jgi:hypothetical protein
MFQIPVTPTNSVICVVVETLPREELVAVQTPQAFVASVLRAAFAASNNLLLEGFCGRALTRLQAGDLQVILPPKVDVKATADVRLGGATLFDQNSNGVSVRIAAQIAL